MIFTLDQENAVILDPTSMSAREAYHLLVSAVIPRPIAWVTSRGKNGDINAAPFSFFNAVSADPPTIMIAIGRHSAGMKDTSRNILAGGDFAVNMVTEKLAPAMNITSTPFPPEINEAEHAGLSLIPAQKISAPLIAESPVTMECVVHSALEIGRGPTDVIFGTVVLFHIDDAMFENGRMKTGELRAVGRLSGNLYCRTTDVFELARPR